MSENARKAKASKVAWQEDDDRLHFRVLCELQLLRVVREGFLPGQQGLPPGVGSAVDSNQLTGVSWRGLSVAFLHAMGR